MEAVKKQGIIEQANDDLHTENLQRLGYTVFRQLIPPDIVARIKAAMYDCYARQIEEVGGIENLRKMKDDFIARSMFAYDRIFLDQVIMQDTILPYLDRHLDGAFVLFSQVGVFSQPGQELHQTAWHREIQYQHFSSDRPLAMQTLFILDPFNAETGGTFLLPGSHLFAHFPSDEFVRQNMIQPELQPGDVVLTNAMLYHKAGVNHSPNDRLLITNTFVRPVFASHFNYPAMIAADGLSEREREILGFRWNYSQTMHEWRMRRISDA